MFLRLLPRLVVLLLAAAVMPVRGAEGDLDRAAQLREEAKALRDQADETLRAAEPGCYERFLVNRCLALAKEARLETVRHARELESEANRLEIAERRRQAGERGLASPAPPAQIPDPLVIDQPETAGRPAATGSAGAPAQPSDALSDEAAAAKRRERATEAERAAEAAAAERRASDAEKAPERAAAEAEAAERASKAREDRERYEERIREREAQRAAEGKKGAE